MGLGGWAGGLTVAGIEQFTKRFRVFSPSDEIQLGSYQSPYHSI